MWFEVKQADGLKRSLRLENIREIAEFEFAGSKRTELVLSAEESIYTKESYDSVKTRFSNCAQHGYDWYAPEEPVESEPNASNPS
jgi:hypothetical protein